MCVPHFEKTGTNEVARSEHAEQVLVESEDNVPAIGIDENAALVVDGDKAMVDQVTILTTGFFAGNFLQKFHYELHLKCN